MGDGGNQTSPSTCWPVNSYRFSVMDECISNCVRTPRPYGAGARNSARALPTACDAAGHGQGTSGTWTKSSSGSAACSTISGAPSIRMVSRSTFWFRPGAMPRAADATVQIARAGPGLPLCSRIHSWPLPSTPTHHGSHRLPRSPVHGIQCLAAGDVRSASGVINNATALRAPRHHSRLT